MLSLLRSLLLLSTIVSLAYGLTDDETEPVFDYSEGPNGPHNWGNLSPEWSACGSGRSQSPVNIRKKDLEDDELIKGLQFSYRSARAVLQTRDHDIAVEWNEDGGTLYLAGTQYRLLQLHLHSPSEHTINGFRYPLEAHLVHEGPDSKLAVISLLYKYGKEDHFLAQLIKEFPDMMENRQTEIDIGNVTVDSMKLGKSYYHYTGSLTTPPCTEGVTWIIMKKKRNVAKEQVQAIIKAELGENSRPLQPLNGRHIYKYE